MTEPEPKKPKIFVDEDWKTKVQAEKEALKDSPAEAESGEKDSVETQPTDVPIPDASFSFLATSLATQTLVALGHTHVPNEENVPVNLDLAKHFIDTLDILEQKTKGNLTPDESKLLTGFLYELRMTFVAVKNKIESQGSEP